jgi:hypothetical protein
MGELQLQIIERLRGIEDQEILRGVLAYLESFDEDQVFLLTEEDERQLDMGAAEVEQGLVMPHEEFMKEMLIS